MTTGENHIGFKRSAKGGKTYTTFNPKLNIENEQIFTEASSEEINQAAELAAEAFKSFSKKSGLEKANFLRAIADEIIAIIQDLDSHRYLWRSIPCDLFNCATVEIKHRLQSRWYKLC